LGTARHWHPVLKINMIPFPAFVAAILGGGHSVMRRGPRSRVIGALVREPVEAHNRAQVAGV
jgi:hypothetical protein